MVINPSKKLFLVTIPGKPRKGARDLFPGTYRVTIQSRIAALPFFKKFDGLPQSIQQGDPFQDKIHNPGLILLCL